MSRVDRDLGIRAQGSCSRPGSSEPTARDETVRRFAAFDPLLDNRQVVDLPWPFAASTMLHAWRHEEANLICSRNRRVGIVPLLPHPSITPSSQSIGVKTRSLKGLRTVHVTVFALKQPQTGGTSTDTLMKDGRHLEHERVGQHYD